MKKKPKASRKARRPVKKWHNRALAIELFGIDEVRQVERDSLRSNKYV